MVVIVVYYFVEFDVEIVYGEFVYELNLIMFFWYKLSENGIFYVFFLVDLKWLYL